MPKKPRLSPDEIYDIIKHIRFRMENGKVLPYSDPKWSEASALLKKMSKDYLFQYVTQNRNGLLDRLDNFNGHSNNDTTNISQQRTHPNNNVKENVSLDKSKNISSNTQEVYINQDNSNKLHDSMDNCDSSKSVSTPTIIPHKKDAEISTIVSQQKIHPDNNIKEYVSSDENINISSETQEVYINQDNSNELNDYMNNCDYSKSVSKPTIIPHKKYEEILKIIELKNSSEYFDNIQQIGIHQFYVMYWSPLQIFVYKELEGQNLVNRIVINVEKFTDTFSEDFRGSAGILYLFEAQYISNNSCIPLFQMISEHCTQNIVSFWINEWLSLNIPILKMIEIDVSTTLINTTPLAFNGMTIENYLNLFFDPRTIDQVNPIYLIRISITSLINFIWKWPSLHKLSSTARLYFIKCLIYLNTVTSVSTFKITLINMISVFNFQSNSGRSHDAKCQLDKYVETKKAHDYINNIDEFVNDNNGVENENICISNLYIDQLLESVLSHSLANASSEPNNNQYHCNELCAELIILSTYFPLWTAVTPDSFNSDSNISLPVPTVRREKKITWNNQYSQEYNNGICNRLVSHLNFISDKMQLIAAENKITLQQNRFCIKTQTNVNNKVENDTTTSICSNVNNGRKDNNNQCWPKNIPILVNGNNLSSVRLESNNHGALSLKVLNTCSFDTIIQIILCSYIESADYRQYLDSIKDNKTIELIKNLANHGIHDDIYKIRAQILMDIKPYKNGKLNCRSNISSMIQSLLTDIPSVTQVMKCNVCNVEKTEITEVITVKLHDLYEQGITALNKSLNRTYVNDSSRCDKCHSKVHVQIQNSKHMFIDIEPLQWTICAKKNGFNQNYRKKFCLSELPIELKFLKTVFQLKGAVEYIKCNSTTHSAPYIRRGNNEWELRDDTMDEVPVIIKQKELERKRIFYVLFYVQNNG